MSDKPIYVTKSFLPPENEYINYLDKIWKNTVLTNQGPLLKEFEQQVKKYLNVSNFQFVANGTLALQLALKTLDAAEGEVITTPFSYVATTSAILWEGFTPIFVDIDESTLNIDPEKIEASITSKTKAILAVHVFGNPCNVTEISKIAAKHNIPVIYDAAHAFGVKIDGQSVFNFGDISMCSFHATKVIHTIEGGGIVTSDAKISSKIELMKRFGHNKDNHLQLGINAKASEFQAAMGLSVLKYVDQIIEKRKYITKTYNKHIDTNNLTPIKTFDNVDYNYSYYPIIFKQKQYLEQTINSLNEQNIYPRRYFFPSLNELPYLERHDKCPVSEYLSKRILCLPIYPGLEESNVIKIAKLVNESNNA